MEAFDSVGPRTKVRPYLCEDGVAHAVCSACDRTLYVRQDDRCPICRAGRSGSSVRRNGPRPMSLPPPMISHAPGVGVWHDAFVSTPGGEAQVRADFLSWLPRRVGLNGQRVIDGGVPSPVSSGAGSYGMGWGGRIFYPVDVADDGVSADLGNGFIEAYRAAASGRRRRSEPIDTVVIEEEDPVPIPSVESPINALHDTAMAALLGDQGIGAALHGLTNLHSVSVIDFAHRVQGARRAAQRG